MILIKKLRVLIACGGGIATSSFAASEIEQIAKEANVSVELHKDRIVNVPLVADDYDLCCVTAKYSQDIGIPLIQISGLIIGINEDKVREEIKNKLIEIANKG